jgi:hypothetical protein
LTEHPHCFHLSNSHLSNMLTWLTLKVCAHWPEVDLAHPVLRSLFPIPRSPRPYASHALVFILFQSIRLHLKKVKFSRFHILL